ncbi:MAG: endonuclease/exonuclease/phosphatase family protein [Alphaproteobacteria bacterium]|nr:endonuclease/exonuclease/phosphatase family protein [Alphaproteobacteria bacterium]
MLSLALVLSGLSAPARADCGDGAPVKIVTLNTWGLPAPIAPERRARMPRIERWLEEAAVDVAGLQEVWRGALKLLKSPLSTGRSDGDHGLALRSPHPLSNEAVHTFRTERGFDAWKAKGVLSAEVDLGGDPVRVAVTHLQSGGGQRNAGVRSAQVDELLAAVGTSDAPLVLMGDFNFYDDEPADAATHASLLEAGFVDVANEVGATRGTYPGLSHRFDRVYVRSRCAVPVSAEVPDAAALSDHRPVLVELSL